MARTQGGVQLRLGLGIQLVFDQFHVVSPHAKLRLLLVFCPLCHANVNQT
jgi:hypothetical protein